MYSVFTCLPQPNYQLYFLEKDPGKKQMYIRKLMNARSWFLVGLSRMVPIMLIAVHMFWPRTLETVSPCYPSYPMHYQSHGSTLYTRGSSFSTLDSAHTELCAPFY